MPDEAPPKPAVRISIQVNPNAPTERDSAELLALAEEAIAQAPVPVAISAGELARLAGRTFYGKQLRAAEWPAGVDREAVETLMHHIKRWDDWPRRHLQLMDAEEWADHVRLTVERPCCQMARDLAKRKLAGYEAERVPLAGCWQERCRCRYEVVSKRLAGKHR